MNPSAEETDRLRELRRKVAHKKKIDLENAALPAVTTDGHAIEVVANIGGLADARSAMALGGEGVGLLRTEFLFLDRRAAPTEEEQVGVYSGIAAALKGRPLVIRTLDVGGDKPLPYMPMAKEENPMLGERGVRIGLNRPEVLRTQLRAILRAASAGKIMVMFPMVATLTEWRAARAIFEEERTGLGAAPVPVGIMIEIPAAAIMAEQFAREADFFSVGTNDLTQYTLAMDRGHPKLAPQVDGLNPGVLRLIAQAVEGARRHGRWVGRLRGHGERSPGGADPGGTWGERTQRERSRHPRHQGPGPGASAWPIAANWPGGRFAPIRQRMCEPWSPGHERGRRP